MGAFGGGFGKSLAAVAALVAVLCLAPRAQAASGPEIDASARATMEDFFQQVWSGRELANKAAAILIFPTVVKAGIGIGGEYGEGALHVRGRTAGFYNIISASIGFQLGAQARSVIIMFMTRYGACWLPAQRRLEGRRRWVGRHHHGRRRRADRQQQRPQPGDRLHLRPEGADV